MRDETWEVVKVPEHTAAAALITISASLEVSSEAVGRETGAQAGSMWAGVEASVLAWTAFRRGQEGVRGHDGLPYLLPRGFSGVPAVGPAAGFMSCVPTMRYLTKVLPNYSPRGPQPHFSKQENSQPHFRVSNKHVSNLRPLHTTGEASAF